MRDETILLSRLLQLYAIILDIHKCQLQLSMHNSKLLIIIAYDSIEKYFWHVYMIRIAKIFRIKLQIST